MLQRIPPVVSPSCKPLLQPLKQPFLIDPSCVLALMPQRDNKWYDYSGKGNHGILNGAIFNAKGPFGPAMFFDGIDDKVTVADSDSLDITEELTLEAWLKYEDSLSTDCHPVIWKSYYIGGPHTMNTYSIGFEPATHKVKFGISGNGNVVYSLVSTNAYTPPTDWVHIVGVFKSTTMDVYVNGAKAVPQLTGVPAAIFVTDKPVRIGFANKRVGNFFKGTVSSVRIYNRALTGGEIKRNYDLG